MVSPCSCTIGSISGGERPVQCCRMLSTSALPSSAANECRVGRGNFGGSGGSAAFWDQTNSIRQVSDLLVNDFGVDLSGWTLNEATGISADGLTIVGTGTNPNGLQEAWIAKFANFNGTSFVGIGTLDNTVPPELLIVAATGDVAGTLVSLIIVTERL